LQKERLCLKKNYTRRDSSNNKHLKEGTCCVTKECGLSEYPHEFDEQTGEWSSFNDEIEWCWVEIIMTGIDPDSDEGCVRAEDLQSYIFL